MFTLLLNEVIEPWPCSVVNEWQKNTRTKKKTPL